MPTGQPAQKPPVSVKGKKNAGGRPSANAAIRRAVHVTLAVNSMSHATRGVLAAVLHCDTTVPALAEAGTVVSLDSFTVLHDLLDLPDADAFAAVEAAITVAALESDAQRSLWDALASVGIVTGRAPTGNPTLLARSVVKAALTADPDSPRVLRDALGQLRAARGE